MNCRFLSTNNKLQAPSSK